MNWSVESDKPKPGDVRVVDGVEYIYARNRKFNISPDEPEYQWVPKDQYSPGVFDSVASRMTGQSTADKQERAELQQRMAKLEADITNKKTTPQAANPMQTAALPSTRLMGPAPAIGFRLSLAKNEEARPHPALGRHDQLQGRASR